jgi:hypothetical protein
MGTGSKNIHLAQQQLASSERLVGISTEAVSRARRRHHEH